jgi:hypothetical protein
LLQPLSATLPRAKIKIYAHWLLLSKTLVFEKDERGGQTSVNSGLNASQKPFLLQGKPKTIKLSELRLCDTVNL